MKIKKMYNDYWLLIILALLFPTTFRMTSPSSSTPTSTSNTTPSSKPYMKISLDYSKKSRLRNRRPVL